MTKLASRYAIIISTREYENWCQEVGKDFKRLCFAQPWITTVQHHVQKHEVTSRFVKEKNYFALSMCSGLDGTIGNYFFSNASIRIQGWIRGPDPRIILKAESGSVCNKYDLQTCPKFRQRNI
jgi:hypothetical protein